MGLLQKQNAISQIGNLAGGLVGALSGNLAAGVESIYTAATGTYLLNENINAQKESHDLIPPTAKVIHLEVMLPPHCSAVKFTVM